MFTKFDHAIQDVMNFNTISSEEMVRVLKEFSYVFGRSTYYVDQVGDTKFYVSPSESQWGSKTNLSFSISQLQQKHVNTNTCVFRICITGETTEKRLESIGLGRYAHSYKEENYQELFIATLETEYFKVGDLPYSINDLKVMADLYRHDVPLYPGMTLDMPGYYRIETEIHSCGSCGTEVPGQCWYSDFDGVLTYPNKESHKFHVTCDGNLQLL
jgi:hypothetical protein